MSLPSPSEIFVRAYTERPGETPLGAKPIGDREDQPSPWSLIFDCETTVDAAQSLKVGVYQVRKSGELVEEGVFHEAENLSEDGLSEDRLSARGPHYRVQPALRYLPDCDRTRLGSGQVPRWVQFRAVTLEE